MMRGSSSHRIATAFLAALFLAAGAERAFGLAHCPHHDAGLPSQTADHGSHGGHSDGDDGQASGPCTCVGTCQLGAAQVGPVVAAVQLAAPAVEWRAETAGPDEPRAQLTLSLLPYSTAPPAGR